MAENSAKILIVDDERGVQESFRMIFKDHYDVHTVPTGEEACRVIQEKSPDLMILDILLPGMGGIEVLKKTHKIKPDMLVIVVTADETASTAIEAMKCGAYDYIQKPFNVDELKVRVERALKEKIHKDHLAQSGYEISGKDRFDRIIGNSPIMLELFETLSRLVHSNATVLITGESGTGKELVARALHYNGSRRDDPFVAVQMTTVPPSLLESELFGHEKGAFTGAVQRKRGTIEIANDGTLFLDEIGDMPLEIQGKLLRVIQEREFRRLGGEELIKVDVRFIAATNKNLTRAVQEKHFREDLFYRLNVVPIVIPPLRERKQDIPLLVEYFFERLKSTVDTKVEQFSEDTMSAFADYDWPGNIRELHNVIENLMVMINAKTVLPSHLPKYIYVKAFSQGIFEEKIFQGNDTLERTVSLFEKQIIENALNRSGGILTRASGLLRTTRRKLKYRIDQLDIKVGEYKKRSKVGV
ncbi:MAG: sigma-54 dependent transcriptional regulator [Chlamydiota bacterium]|nr:sigma-54 dependent transcriptional regulator [Chlamydiota bacterium]